MDSVVLVLAPTVNGPSEYISLADDNDMTCYTESYQSWEVVTAGQVVYAWQPNSGLIAYETGNGTNGCEYQKCPNGYALFVSNWNCKQGHCGTNTWASGYPVCPHGDTRTGSYYRHAHCHNDSGWDTPGYRAPCGRTTHRTDDIYGYVTRTRTPTGCHSTISQHEYHLIRSCVYITSLIRNETLATLCTRSTS